MQNDEMPRAGSSRTKLIVYVIIAAALIFGAYQWKQARADMWNDRTPAQEWSKGTKDSELLKAINADDPVAFTKRLAEVPKDSIRPNMVVLLTFDRYAKVLDALLSAGWDVKGPKGDNAPLHTALYVSQPVALEVLLKHGADPHAVNSDGFPPIIVAATDEYKSEELVTVLLKHGASATEGPDKSKHSRTFRGVTPYATTAIEAAVREGAVETVRLLAKHGANPNAFDRFGNPLVVDCAMFGQRGTANFSGVPLHNGPKVLAALLELGANPNTMGAFAGARHSALKRTAIYCAAEGGDAEMVEILLKHGADPAIKSEEGKNAIDVASGDAKKLLDDWAAHTKR